MNPWRSRAVVLSCGLSLTACSHERPLVAMAMEDTHLCTNGQYYSLWAMAFQNFMDHRNEQLGNPPLPNCRSPSSPSTSVRRISSSCRAPRHGSAAAVVSCTRRTGRRSRGVSSSPKRTNAVRTAVSEAWPGKTTLPSRPTASNAYRSRASFRNTPVSNMAMPQTAPAAMVPHAPCARNIPPVFMPKKPVTNVAGSINVVATDTI